MFFINILAIETSCDDTSAAVVRNGNIVLSSIINSQAKKHNEFGGVFPEIAARMHCDAIVQTVEKAISEAKIFVKNLDAIAVTYAPGLIGSLLVGVNFAKGFSLAQKIPLIPVHHLRGHIASLYITNPELTPPFLCLLVSGGHTHIIEVKSYVNFKILAKTRDDAVGECFDKVARYLGLAYPGGVNLDIFAENGDENKYFFKTPKLSDGSFSFSGFKTNVVNLINKINKNNPEVVKNFISSELNSLCASFRKTIIDYLISNFIKCAKNANYQKLAISGGVSANSLLRKNLKEACVKNKFEFYMPNLKYCGDNAAMIGVQAYHEYKNLNIANYSLNAYANRNI